MFKVNPNSWHYRFYRKRTGAPEATEHVWVGFTYIMQVGLGLAAYVAAFALAVVPIAAVVAIVFCAYWSLRALAATALFSIALSSRTPLANVPLAIIGFVLMAIALALMPSRLHRRDGWSGLTDRRTPMPPTGPTT